MLAEAGVSYAGPGARARAELAGAIVRERMHALHGSNAPLRIDLIGVSSLHATAREAGSDPQDVRLRAALRATRASRRSSCCGRSNPCCAAARPGAAAIAVGSPPRSSPTAPISAATWWPRA